MPENKEAAPTTEGQQEAAQPSDTKAKAATTASDELIDEDLKAVAGGITRDGKGGLIVDPLKN